MMRFVVALRAEARPLIEHFGLSPSGPQEEPFRWYQSGAVSLVVSGIGKTAAAAATAYLHAKTLEEPCAVWMNIGIAGHRDRSPGELVRAHTIADAASGECFYPTLLGLTELGAAKVTTVDAAETEFPTEDIYDMEASGFYQTAVRFSTGELVQCLKIVSDNHETGTEDLTTERVSELVSSHLGTIDVAAGHLREIAEELEPLRSQPEDLEGFRNAWHFTTTQARLLRRLLARCRTLDPESVPTPTSLGKSQTAADVLRAIDSQIRSLALGRRGF